VKAKAGPGPGLWQDWSQDLLLACKSICGISTADILRPNGNTECVSISHYIQIYTYICVYL